MTMNRHTIWKRKMAALENGWNVTIGSMIEESGDRLPHLLVRSSKLRKKSHVPGHDLMPACLR